MKQADNDRSKAIQAIIEQHKYDIETMKQQHEQAMKTEHGKITDLQQTLQKQQIESAEFHQQQLQSAMEQAKNNYSQIIQSLMEQHEQAIDTMKQQHEQEMTTELSKITDLRQMLERQEALLQEERRKYTAMKQCMDRLEEIARKDASHIKELKEQIAKDQRIYESEKHDMQTSYEQAWILAKKQRQTIENTFQEESTRLQQQLLHHQLRNQKLNRLICQLVIVTD
jgi:hypothetical protein